MTHTIALRTAEFAKLVRLAGFRSDYELARAMGLNRSTVTRVREGLLQPGPAFIAGSLIVLNPLEFKDLFKIVERPGKK
ncbi:transcriptional regulator [Saccharothrix xinjiangensis]|uniref:Transcriptional regulator n=1 Tax=Saccharothrix xinjiangensis TaxID=204798 RepID=A0ABV9Y6Q7_9PSEU